MGKEPDSLLLCTKTKARTLAILQKSHVHFNLTQGSQSPVLGGLVSLRFVSGSPGKNDRKTATFYKVQGDAETRLMVVEHRPEWLDSETPYTQKS